MSIIHGPDDIMMKPTNDNVKIDNVRRGTRRSELHGRVSRQAQQVLQVRVLQRHGAEGAIRRQRASVQALRNLPLLRQPLQRITRSNTIVFIYDFFTNFLYMLIVGQKFELVVIFFLNIYIIFYF